MPDVAFAAATLHLADNCLNRAVTNRHTLRLGEDAEEVDSWGMDCYVRRNIMDGVLRTWVDGLCQPQFMVLGYIVFPNVNPSPVICACA